MSLCREGWQDHLKELIAKLNISVAFDAIAGDMSGTIMEVNYIIIISVINVNFFATIIVFEWIFEADSP